MNDEILMVRISKELKDKIKAKAKERNITISAYVKLVLSKEK